MVCNDEDIEENKKCLDNNFNGSNRIYGWIIGVK